MSYVNLFRTQTESLNSFQYDGLSVSEQGTLQIGVKGKEVQHLDFDQFFQIRGKIQKQLSGIHKTGSVDEVKNQLKELKEAFITKLNVDRGHFRNMGEEEKMLLETYFSQMEQILDRGAKGKVRRMFEGALKLAAFGALVYGAYSAYNRAIKAQ